MHARFLPHPSCHEHSAAEFFGLLHTAEGEKPLEEGDLCMHAVNQYHVSFTLPMDGARLLAIDHS
jgi:hypothetical protein